MVFRILTNDDVCIWSKDSAMVSREYFFSLDVPKAASGSGSGSRPK
jgi:hypothetical protein